MGVGVVTARNFSYNAPNYWVFMLCALVQIGSWKSQGILGIVISLSFAPVMAVTSISVFFRWNNCLCYTLSFDAPISDIGVFM